MFKKFLKSEYFIAVSILTLIGLLIGGIFCFFNKFEFIISSCFGGLSSILLTFVFYFLKEEKLGKNSLFHNVIFIFVRLLIIALALILTIILLNINNWDLLYSLIVVIEITVSYSFVIIGILREDKNDSRS